MGSVNPLHFENSCHQPLLPFICRFPGSAPSFKRLALVPSQLLPSSWRTSKPMQTIPTGHAHAHTCAHARAHTHTHTHSPPQALSPLTNLQAPPLHASQALTPVATFSTLPSPGAALLLIICNSGIPTSDHGLPSSQVTCSISPSVRTYSCLHSPTCSTKFRSPAQLSLANSLKRLCLLPFHFNYMEKFQLWMTPRRSHFPRPHLGS